MISTPTQTYYVTGKKTFIDFMLYLLLQSLPPVTLKRYNSAVSISVKMNETCKNIFESQLPIKEKSEEELAEEARIAEEREKRREEKKKKQDNQKRKAKQNQQSKRGLKKQRNF